MRPRNIARRVALAVAAIALVAMIGSTSGDSPQQVFVQCIETTKQTYPTAKFDELNAFCMEELRPVD